MHKQAFESFVNGGKKKIGTADLAGCTAVIIASDQGAIFAHIPAKPDDEVAAQMVEVAALLHQHSATMKQPVAYVVSGKNEKGTVLKMEKVIEAHLVKLGLQAHLHTYNMISKAELIDAIKNSLVVTRGVVVVDGTVAHPKIYVDEVAIN